MFREDIRELLARDLRRIEGYIFVALPVKGSDTGNLGKEQFDGEFVASDGSGIRLDFSGLLVEKDWSGPRGFGPIRLRRTYSFEFSDTGDNRRHGAIVMLGGELQDMQLEPYQLQ